jgi:hypothetical protein
MVRVISTADLGMDFCENQGADGWSYSETPKDRRKKKKRAKQRETVVASSPVSPMVVRFEEGLDLLKGACE